MGDRLWTMGKLGGFRGCWNLSWLLRLISFLVSSWLRLLSWRLCITCHIYSFLSYLRCRCLHFLTILNDFSSSTVNSLLDMGNFISFCLRLFNVHILASCLLCWSIDWLCSRLNRVTFLRYHFHSRIILLADHFLVAWSRTLRLS